MKIKSRFKDYYDYVAFAYGGGDPKVVYNRDRFKPLENNAGEWISPIIYVSAKLQRDVNPLRFHLAEKYLVKYLVICNKFYLLVHRKGIDPYEEYHVLNRDLHPEVINYIRSKPAIYSDKSYNPKSDLPYYIGFYDENLQKISKELKSPVFVIDDKLIPYDLRRNPKVAIDNEIPILSTLGIPSIYPAEQLYQDIAYFLGNTLRTNPDIEPPAKVSDKDRIIQHGFDIKQSFRHRKD